MTKLLSIIGKALSGEWGKDDATGNGIPVLRTTNFTNEGSINFANIVTRIISKNTIGEKFLRSGDIIIEKSGGSDKQPVGRVIYYEGEENKYLFNNFTGLLRVKNKEKWIPKYVFYSLFANYWQGGTKAYENKTTGLHNLKLDSYIQDTDIKECSLEKQNQICITFDRLRNIIALRKSELNIFDNLIKARFVEMFGDPILNDKRWITSSIEDTCIEIYGGGTPSKQHPEYYENGSIPWVTSKDMKCDVICDSQIHINEKGLENSTARMVPTNSIVMVIRSGILKHTLPVAVNTVPITVNQDLKVFIPDSQKIMSRFFALQLKMHERDILSGVRAVTADNIEFNELKKRKIIIPPLVLQQLFIDFLIQIDKSKLRLSTVFQNYYFRL